MSNEKTGGPAYPSANDVRIDTPQGAMGTGGHPGMTLLDHFAGMAMQSIMANGASLGSDKGAAEVSYRIAAAMVAERKRLMEQP